MAEEASHPGVFARHRIPILITGIGLLVAIVLGVSPLLRGGAPEPTQVAAPADSEPLAADVADLDTRISQVEATLSDRLDVIDLRLTNLDKAVTRGHVRVVALQDGQADYADSAGMVRTLEAQVAILNKAVPRLNARIRSLASDGPDDMDEVRQSVSALEAQVHTLNRAVTRLSERIRNFRQDPMPR